MTEPANPNFFVIGAPKCGTSTLSGWLGRHPEVFMSVPKEPHYFCSDLNNRKVTDWSAYANLFRNARIDHLAIGEASTWYLRSECAVETIESSLDAPRYIVLTRPVPEMVESLFFHNRFKLYEDCRSLERAWDLQEIRSNGDRIPASCPEPVYLQYRYACSLGSMLARLRETVPATRVLHVELGDIVNAPRQVQERVATFLGISAGVGDSFQRDNARKAYRSRKLQHLIRMGAKVRFALGIRRGIGLGRINERTNTEPRVDESVRERILTEMRDEEELRCRLISSMNDQGIRKPSG